MFCTIFGALTLDHRLPPKGKTEMAYLIGKHFGLPKDEIKEMLDELDKTLEYTIKGLNKNGFNFDKKEENYGV